VALARLRHGYAGLTRDAYKLQAGLRQYLSWCQQRGLHLFAARRADVECFGRDLHLAGAAR
jgi:integrase/recombinase XerD